MATIYENAQLKQRDAVCALYEDYRFLAAGITELLGGGKELLPLIWKEILNGLGKAGVDTEEDFRSYVIKQTVAACRADATEKDKDAFRSASLRSGELPEKTAEATLTEFRSALDKLSLPERYASVLGMFGMDSIEAGRALKLKPASVEKLMSSASLKLASELNGRVPDGLGDVIISYTDDEESDKVCRELIKNETVSGSRKVLIAAAAGVVLLLALVLALGKAGRKPDDPQPVEPSDPGYEFTIDMDATYYADIEIEDYGTITVVLDQSQAPISVDNFVKLAQSGFYDGLTFHRIMAGFMMQGGAGQGASTIKGEFSANGVNNGISHERGVISMARANPYDSGSSQFFIMHADYPSLDGKYAAFGHVISGIEVVDAVCESAKPVDNNGTIPAEEQPVIKTIRIYTEP